MHLTHGAVSRQIQQLEHALGVSLFERRNRSVVPTPAAHTLAREVADALGLLNSATRRTRAAVAPGPLVLSCEPTLLMRWLIPRLPLLTDAAPGLDLHLVASGGPVPFDREGIDAAIRRNDFELPEGVPAHRLFDERIGPVCSPELARGLISPAGLADLPRLHTRTRPTAWSDWAACAGTALPAGATEQTFEHFYLSLQAAASGLGVAIGPLALVHDDVRAGRLVAPFGFEADGSAYVLLTILPPEDERVAVLLRRLGEQAGHLLI
ncbi:LysR family transcriptional regulator [Streptomyces sp. NPDC002133]|uniref:LysR family transcriptional regulator n=1 Tax=Streptomyces sp. NPDC002133 TaxID=3154409 RepID=UPI0033201204